MEPDDVDRSRSPGGARLRDVLCRGAVMGLLACNLSGDAEPTGTSTSTSATEGATGTGTGTGTASAATTSASAESTGTSGVSSTGAASTTGAGSTTSPATMSGTSGTSGGGQILEVLFIGNSYTAGNDLDGLIIAIADADGDAPTLITETIAIGGATMGAHLATPSTVAAITEGSWDFVVLQGQSVEPLLIDSGFTEAAVELAQIVVDSGATPVLFETWAREEGHELYLEDWYGETPEAVQAQLRAAYQGAADMGGGVMAPVGDAWEVVWTAAPQVELYSGDGSHGSIAGSYLAACVFFEVLTGRSPVGDPSVPEGIDGAEAMVLQEAADGVFP